MRAFALALLSQHDEGARCMCGHARRVHMLSLGPCLTCNCRWFHAHGVARRALR